MSNALKDLRKERLKKLVDLNDMLSRQIEAKDQIKFPKIVICGDQSHGKTSLIENIIEFPLPRGDGTQTRVPFRIQMRQGPELKLILKYKDNDGKMIEKQVQPENLEQEMRQAQTIVTGDETSIKNEVVDLEISQPDLDTLTIIDLPGFIQFQENVNDSNNTTQVLKEMYDYYLKDSDTTICVVVNATSNLQTSSTFTLARKHDFVGSRTILCITKIDQKQDTSYDDFKIKAQKNNIDKLFFVRNRTQAEVDNGMSFADARKLEEQFIENNQYLRQFPNNSKGLHNMCKCLIELQEKSIVPNLIENKNKLQNLLKIKKKELEELGEELTNKKNIENFIMRKFDSISDSIKNQYYEIDDTIENKEFEETKHTKSDIGQTFSTLFYISDITIEYYIEKPENNKLKISFQSNKPCGIKVETESTSNDDIIIYRHFQLELQQEKVSHIELEGGDEFILKIVNRPPNIFLEYYSLRDEFEKFIKQRYLIQYFLSEEFEQFFKNEKKRVQQQFGLNDRDFANLAERVLKHNILPSVRQSAEKFLEKSSKNLLDIWLTKNQRIFIQFPQVMEFIQQLIYEEFIPQKKNLDQNLEIDFITSSQLNTRNDMYEIMQDIMKTYLLEGTQEDNVLLKNHLQKVPKDKIRDLYQNEDKRNIYNEGLRMWSYWNIVSIRLLDIIINKVPLFLIQYPIQNIRDSVFRKIIDIDEKKLRKLVNSEEKVEQRKKKQQEIKVLQDCMDMIKDSINDGLVIDSGFMLKDKNDIGQAETPEDIIEESENEA